VRRINDVHESRIIDCGTSAASWIVSAHTEFERPSIRSNSRAHHEVSVTHFLNWLVMAEVSASIKTNSLKSTEPPAARKTYHQAYMLCMYVMFRNVRPLHCVCHRVCECVCVCVCVCRNRNICEDEDTQRDRDKARETVERTRVGNVPGVLRGIIR
jgi:hypothetical protein